jgi:hypothetical protein
MGVVLRGRHRGLGCIRAIKVLEERDANRVARFQREATALASVRHRNIVKVHDCGQHGAYLYFAMDLIEGGSTFEDLMRKGMTLPRALELVEKTARGLHALHSIGFIHRDIKPNNLLVDSEGEPVIIDLGLVTGSNEERLTKTGAMVGTLGYMAPEQAHSPDAAPTPALDVYSLGAVLYEAASGTPPIEATTPHEFLIALGGRDIPAPSLRKPGLPDDLDAICARALARDPGERYQNALAFANDLAALRGGRRPSASQDAPRYTSRARRSIAGLATACLVLIAVIVLLVLQKLRTVPVDRAAAVATLEADLDALTRKLREPSTRFDRDAAQTERGALDLAAKGSELAKGMPPGDPLAPRARAAAANADAIAGTAALRRHALAAATSLAGQGAALAPGTESDRRFLALGGGIAALASPCDAARADELLTRAIDADRERGDVLLWRALARARAASRKAALADASRAAALGFTDPRCSLVVLALVGDPEEARRGIQANPGLADPSFARPFAARAVGVLQARGAPADALAALHEALTFANPGSPEVAAVGKAALERARAIGLPCFQTATRETPELDAVVAQCLELAAIAELAAPDARDPELASAAVAIGVLLQGSSLTRFHLHELAAKVNPESFSAWIGLVTAPAWSTSEAERFARGHAAAARARALAFSAEELVAAMTEEAELFSKELRPAEAVALAREALARLDKVPGGGEASLRQKLLIHLCQWNMDQMHWPETLEACKEAERSGCLYSVVSHRSLAREGMGDYEGAIADVFVFLQRDNLSEDERAGEAARIELLAHEGGFPPVAAEAVWAQLANAAHPLRPFRNALRQAALTIELDRTADARAQLAQAGRDKPEHAQVAAVFASALESSCPRPWLADWLRLVAGNVRE